MDLAVHKRLKNAALRLEMPMHELARQAVSYYLDELGEPEAYDPRTGKTLWPKSLLESQSSKASRSRT
jgi:hypothetical protein